MYHGYVDVDPSVRVLVRVVNDEYETVVVQSGNKIVVSVASGFSGQTSVTPGSMVSSADAEAHIVRVDVDGARPRVRGDVATKFGLQVNRPVRVAQEAEGAVDGLACCLVGAVHVSAPLRLVVDKNVGIGALVGARVLGNHQVELIVGEVSGHVRARSRRAPEARPS